MLEREVIQAVLRHQRPPDQTRLRRAWSFRLTREARDKLAEYYGTTDLETKLHNHIVELGGSNRPSAGGFFTDIGVSSVKDVFGVVWDRSVDRDIGIVVGCVLPEPTLRGYKFPDPLTCVVRRASQYAIRNTQYEKMWTNFSMTRGNIE